jgi:NDP-sugar pyrophosphorylase family protein
VVADRPKPMADIAGRPFLEHLLAHLRGQGVRSAVLLTGYMAEEIERHFGDGSAHGMRLRYSVEREPRGTAGALKLAEPLLEGERWLVLNGDTFFDIDYGRLLDEHLRSAATATLALARVADASRYGTVELRDDGRMARLGEPVAGPALVNGGVYAIERALLGHIPPGRPASLERDVLPRLADGQLHGVVFDAELIDIGTPDAYLRFRGEPPTAG